MRDVLSELETLFRRIVREEVAFAIAHLQNRPEILVEKATDKLKSLKETAEYLGISSAMMHRLMKSNAIGYYRVGRRILFSTDKHITPYLSSTEASEKARRTRLPE